MASRSGESALPGDLYAGTLDCVHCGLCLSSCPTYLVTGRETSSPRGRIYLMRGVAEAAIDLGALLEEEAFLCLGCRACETACPSGVRYGELLEGTREAVQVAGLRRGVAARFERQVLRHVVPHARRLKWMTECLAWAQRTGLDRAALAALGWLPGARRLASSLAESLTLLPTIPRRGERLALPEFTPAEGERRGRVALLEGCVMRELLPGVNHATLRVLTRNGFDVLVPRSQGCCGALQAHAGDAEAARALTRVNIAAFDALDVDALVVNSAGCGAAMRETDRRLPGEGARMASLVRDVAEFLDEVGLRSPTGSVHGRVCYDDPCHLIHGQRVAAAPRRLLAAVEGLELVEHAEASSCCGAAGTYNLTHPAMAKAVLARKLDALAVVDPDWIATGNPGCLMQIGAGTRARGLRARVVHPVELLDAAYAGGQ